MINGKNNAMKRRRKLQEWESFKLPLPTTQYRRVDCPWRTKDGRMIKEVFDKSGTDVQKAAESLGMKVTACLS